MKRLFLSSSILLIALLGIFFSSCKKKAVEEQTGPVIIAYVQGDASFDASRIAASKVTHINYGFAEVKDGKVVLGSADAGNLAKLVSLKEENPKLKVLISVAGRVLSRTFPEGALTGDAQKTFAISVVDIVTKNNLDGIDINWGYPEVSDKNDTIYNDAAAQNYGLVIKAVKTELDALGEDKKYLLTSAVEADPNFIASAKPASFQTSVDYLNIMSFGYQDTKVAIYQSNLDFSDKYGVKKSVKSTLEAYNGIEPSKLVMGIPFSGITYQMKKDSKTGIGDPIVKRTGNKGYTFIKDSLVNKNEYYRYWDNNGQVPYVYNFYKSELVTYDDEESVKAKCAYVKSNNLAGVMLWKYTDDTKGFLINAINDVLK
ncbi:MAG: chitinase [Prevotella sp.]|jgi:chitinase|nr:chitinase [Prevotella sp.]